MNTLPTSSMVTTSETEASPEAVVTDEENPRRHTWDEFRESGMLWLINTTLHVFGWVIVVVVDEDTDEVVSAYPARTSWRGFSKESNARGHKRVAEYMAKAARELVEEATE